ncbi:MAG: hypothetical protein M1821_004705 [Bathelium mastoideum]|nr:MAG: hypothetical protein M1821_004705 [Bathelium mastoideum]
MFHNPDSASHLIRESPIKFTLEPQGASEYQPTSEFGLDPDGEPTINPPPPNNPHSSLDEDVSPSSHPTTSYTPISPSPSDPPPRDSTQTPPPTTSFPSTAWPRPTRAAKRFHLTADISLMNHSTLISRQERHGPFQIATSSVGYNDLRRFRSIGELPAAGMCDVHVKRREATADEIRQHAAVVRERETLRGLYERGLRDAGLEGREGAGGEEEWEGEYEWGLPKG